MRGGRRKGGGTHAVIDPRNTHRASLDTNPGTARTAPSPAGPGAAGYPWHPCQRDTPSTAWRPGTPSCSPGTRCTPPARRAASPRAPPGSPAPSCDGTEAYGKHLLHHYAGELTLHVHLGLYGKFADGDRASRRSRSGRCGCGWPATGTGWTCAARPPASCSPRPRWRRCATGSAPDPLRADADPDRAYARIAPQPHPARRAAAGPVGGGRHRADLRDRGAVPGRAAADAARPGARPAAGWDALWADLVALMRPAVARGRIDTVRDAAPARGDGPRRRGSTGTAARCTSTAAPAQPCHVCGTAGQPGRAGRPQPLLVPHLPSADPARRRGLTAPSSSQRATSTWLGKTVSPSDAPGQRVRRSSSRAPAPGRGPARR